LYGHNAVHALLGYLANQRGYRFMSEVARDTELMAFGRAAFLEESGRALLARHGGVDPLFTPHGYEQFADDLLARMVNPWLRDAIERVIRDPRRKLAWHDRLIGTMRLALDAGVMPFRFARGAAAALALLGTEQSPESLWPEPDEPPGRKQQLKELILQARNV
jgi:mannitol-1-phosphate 5-dehydrogenase